ncbi:hypothetical protein L208DRAFT_1152329, partial [Tricholoma matsutake]
AHDINVVSTASVLPRTPDHVNQMLSVVFIRGTQLLSSQKPNKKLLKNMFRIRKKKVWDFFVWLKEIAKNPLYTNIILDPCNVELYPDDDTLPGLDQYVVH